MLLSLGLFVCGLCFGSFISALAQRSVVHNSNWRGRSVCLKCHKKILFFDLIPVLSFIFLKGRCRFCKTKIGWREPITEIISGILFVLVGLAHNNQINLLLIRDLIFSVFLILLFLTDIYGEVLPHRFTATAVTVTIILNLLVNNYRANGHSPLQMIIGIIIGGGFFYLQYLISHGRWVGGGDIGMGLFLGAMLGWPLCLVAIGLAYIIGAIFAVILLLKKKVGLDSRLPFGPFLAVAGWVVLVFLN